MSTSINKILGDYHSNDMDIDELTKLIEDFVSDTNPDDEVVEIDFNDQNLIDVKLKSGKEIEFEVDWNEVILK